LFVANIHENAPDGILKVKNVSGPDPWSPRPLIQAVGAEIEYKTAIRLDRRFFAFGDAEKIFDWAYFGYN